MLKSKEFNSPASLLFAFSAAVYFMAVWIFLWTARGAWSVWKDKEKESIIFLDCKPHVVNWLKTFYYICKCHWTMMDDLSYDFSHFLSVCDILDFLFLFFLKKNNLSFSRLQMVDNIQTINLYLVSFGTWILF